jgi:hypothetical protein
MGWERSRWVRPRPGGGTECAEGAAKTEASMAILSVQRVLIAEGGMPTLKASMGSIQLPRGHSCANHTVQFREMPGGLAVFGLQQFESLIQRLVALVGLRSVVVDIVVLGLADEDGGSNGLILNLLTVGSLVLCDRE